MIYHYWRWRENLSITLRRMAVETVQDVQDMVFATWLMSWHCVSTLVLFKCGLCIGNGGKAIFQTLSIQYVYVCHFVLHCLLTVFLSSYPFLVSGPFLHYHWHVKRTSQVSTTLYSPSNSPQINYNELMETWIFTKTNWATAKQLCAIPAPPWLLSLYPTQRHPGSHGARAAQPSASRFILCYKSATAGVLWNACTLCICNLVTSQT